MHCQETIQALNQARFAALKAASENRDVDAVMLWYAKNAVFTDVLNDITREGTSTIREFYTQAYAALPKFVIANPTTTAYTPEFVTAEMTCEGQAGVDLPHMGVKAGERVHMVGVSLFWWKWEGEDLEWDGSLSDEAVRGWKIVRERAYYQMSKK